MTRNLLGTMLVLGALPGCDGGVSDATPLSGLSDAHARVLCEESLDLVPVATREQECTFGALLATGTEEDCVAERDACLAMTPTPSPEIDCASATGDRFGPCTDLTVGDLRACWAALSAQFQDVYERVSCSNVGTEEAPDVAEVSVAPPACIPLRACGAG